MVDPLEVIVNIPVGLLFGFLYGRQFDRKNTYALELQQLSEEDIIQYAGQPLTKEEVDTKARKFAHYSSLGTMGSLTAVNYFNQPFSSSIGRGMACGIGFYLGVYLGKSVSQFSRHRATLSKKEQNIFREHLHTIEEMLTENKPELDINAVEQEIVRYTCQLLESKRNPHVVRDLTQQTKKSHDYVVRYRQIERVMSGEEGVYLFHGGIRDDANAFFSHRSKLYHLSIEARMVSLKQEKPAVKIDAQITGSTVQELPWNGTILGIVNATHHYEKEGRTLVWVKGDESLELPEQRESILKNYLFHYSEKKGLDYMDMKDLN